MATINAKPGIGYEIATKEVAIAYENTINDLLDHIDWPSRLLPYTVVLRDGEKVDEAEWDMPLCEVQDITIAVVPRGGDSDGKDIIRSVALIAVAMVAGPAAGAILGPGVATTSLTYTAVKVGIAVVGTLAVSAMFPPPDQSLGDDSGASKSQSFYLSGQSNQMTPYGIVPRVYGKHKIFPNIVGNPYLLPVGRDKNVMEMLFDFGYGPLEITNIKIGGTDFDAFKQAVSFVHPSFTAGDALQKYTQAVYIQTVNQVAAFSAPVSSTATDPGQEVLLDFSARSWFEVTTVKDSDGNDIQRPTHAGPTFKIEARPVGSTTWQPLGDVITRLEALGALVIFSPTVSTAIDFEIRLPLISGTIDTPAENVRYWNMHWESTGYSNSIYVVKDAGSTADLPSNYLYWQNQWYTITRVDTSGTTSTPSAVKVEFTPAMIDKPGINEQILFADTLPGTVDDDLEYGLIAPFSTFETPDGAKLSAGDIVVIKDAEYEVASVTTGGTVQTVTLTTPVIVDVKERPTEPLPSGFGVYTAFISGNFTGVDTYTFSGLSTLPIASTLKLNMKTEETWQFQIERLVRDSDNDRDELTWNSIRVLGDGPVINPDATHTLLEVSIQATDQISGVIDNLSATAVSKLPRYNVDGTIEAIDYTRNPAWIYCDVLCGEANGHAVDPSQLDMERIRAWAAECDELIPTAGSIENYLLDSSRTHTTIHVHVTDIFEAQTAPKVGQYFCWHSQVVKIATVVVVATVDGRSTYELTIAPLNTPPVADGDYHVVTVATHNTPLQARYTCDLVVDFKSTVKELAEIVCATGRATPTMRDGKYSIIREVDAKRVRQLITNRNAANISASLTYLDLPDAIRVSYVDENTWEQEEVFVYTGKTDPAAAVVFEDLKLVGTTRMAQAYRLGQYYLAEVMKRRETVTCSMDIENLIATRGDIVAIASDVLVDATGGCRVTEVNGNDITVDEHIQMHLVEGIRARHSDGSVVVYSVTRKAGTDDVLTVSGTHSFGVGDLLEYGTPVSLRKNYVVQSISPGTDLSANLTLREHAPEVLNAPNGAIPAAVTLTSLPVASVRHEVFIDDLGYHVALDWTPASGKAANGFNVYRSIDGRRREFVTTTTNDSLTLMINEVGSAALDSIEFFITERYGAFNESAAVSTKILIEIGKGLSITHATTTLAFTKSFTQLPIVTITSAVPTGESVTIENVTLTSADLIGSRALTVDWIALA